MHERQAPGAAAVTDGTGESNRLAGETSPYLLQHADNPVHWQPWSAAAFAEARARDVPVLLSVGYAACHWCHVMAHESFENPAIAAVMNRLFVNIKVDREERPDVDQIYMTALHALGEQGGWPLTMFLTPDGAPFWGGTYFPPEPRFGRPGFVQMLEAVAETYRTKGAAVAQNTNALLAVLRQQRRGDPATLDAGVLDTAAQRLYAVMDRHHGGLQGAPKFPNAAVFELLWRAARRTGRSELADIVVRSLERISNGGIYDHLGGGYARYSVDHRWLVPHFEKMLYDNAQLVSLLTLAYVATGEAGFRRRIEETVGWLTREMVVEDGAFAASLDADSEGVEGKFYVWTPADVADVLGAADAGRFCDAYDVTDGGNFEGHSIPNRLATGFPGDAEEAELAPLRAALLAARAARVRPGRDDKVLADWNGLMIAALADAGAALDRPDWIALAERAFLRILALLGRGDRLGHAARAGRSTFPGLSTDYGAMVRAALALRQATGDERYLAQARAWIDMLDAHHWVEANGAYALAADDANDLIVRMATATDEATPSGNALAADALVRLWLITGEDRYRARADRLFAGFASEVMQNAFGHAALMNAFDTRLGAEQVVVVAATPEDATALAGVVRRTPSPGRVLTVTDGSALPAGHPAAGKRTVDGRAAAYLCRGATCSLPILEPNALVAALR
jgi:uncharacterized protein YyaL (SSP411 family)